MARAHRNLWLIFTGIFLALVWFFVNPLALDSTALKVMSISICMIFLWISEAMPMPVVAIIPLVLFPLLGISTIESTAASYANPVIFLFFGGFMLGLAIEKWNLHKRIALYIIHLTGTGGDRIVLGFILSTGLISMWLSNTATTMMMYPIALSVIAVMSHHQQQGANYRNFNMTIMLAIAYASNIGGIATIIGTPPNVAYVGYFQQKYGVELDFLGWMLVCLPVSLLLLAALYLVMVKWLFPSGISTNTNSLTLLHGERQALGRMTIPEKRVLGVFLLTASLWIFRSMINGWQSYVKLDDTQIAVFGAILLFLIPSGQREDENEGQSSLLEWSDTSRMAWGILLLFGGGICLAKALEDAGLIAVLGQWLGSYSSGIVILILLITILSIFISEVMSNVAQVIVFAPVVTSMAEALQINPLWLGIPMTLAASCAGMLPMGTPPNAIVFASNYIRMKDMVLVGFIMNLISIVLITLSTMYLVPLAFKE
ncbi:MAG: DASS family sodium-coupled anion symporter [Saprospiraceae bacterium]|jgi:sodium-dependent dicarboxylate transporter 2/3/5|nr:DASS family sodium-coupled anion symporter [Saprospiraceae bacterium]